MRTQVLVAAAILVLSGAHVVSAGPLGPVHTTALVFKAGDLPTRPTFEYGWAGVGGDENHSATVGGDDCLDLGAEGGGRFTVSSVASLTDTPALAIKTSLQRVALTDGRVVSDEAAIGEACGELGAATNGLIGTDPEPDAPPSDPQRIGHGDMAFHFSEIWYPVMDFDDTKFAVSATVVSCRVAASGSSPQFTSETNRGPGNLEPVSPAESLAGSTLDGFCIDQTDTLRALWSAGTVNRPLEVGGGTPYSCDTFTDPACGDMPVGLWATCITALVHDPTTNTQGTESDYTWWWVEDANLGLATQWADPMNWDGENWRDDFTSQQPCPSLGTFTT